MAETLYGWHEKLNRTIFLSTFILWMFLFFIVNAFVLVVTRYFLVLPPDESLIYSSLISIGITSFLVYILMARYYLIPSSLFNTFFKGVLVHISNKEKRVKLPIHWNIARYIIIIADALILLLIIYGIAKYIFLNGFFLRNLILSIIIVGILFFFIILRLVFEIYNLLKIEEVELEEVNLKKLEELGITSEKIKELKDIVENLKVAYGIYDKPIKVYIIDLPYINAFVIENPIAYFLYVSDEALKYYDYYELQAVIAHELAHIKNRDSYYMTKAVVIGGLIILLAEFLVRILPRLWFYGSLKSRDRKRKGSVLDLVILILIAIGFIFALISPIVVRILLSKISTAREYRADAKAIEVTKLPKHLARALIKAHNSIRRGYALYKPNDLIGALFFVNLNFRTHPPIKDRLKKIAEIARIPYQELFK